MENFPSNITVRNPTKKQNCINITGKNGTAPTEQNLEIFNYRIYVYDSFCSSPSSI